MSVTILVKNGERYLKEVLDSLQRFDEIIIYDTGSTDKTLTIAKNYPNARIVQKPFTGFGPDHNAAAALARHDWILSIDADEVLSKKLADEILSTSFDPHTVYSLPRHNYYNGKHIKWCGWHPESVTRLYNKKVTAFSEAMVHEKVKDKGLQKAHFSHPIRHYSYASVSDFLQKMEHYSTLFAKQYQYKRKSSPFIAYLHGMTAFFKSFVLKRGFLGGYEGFLISAYNGHTAFYKYLKLYEANKCSSR